MLHQPKMMLHRRCRLILIPHPALKMMLHQPKMMLHRRCRLILGPHPALKMMLHQPKMTLHRRCRLILIPHPALKMMLHQPKMTLHRRFGLKMMLHQSKMMLHLHPGPGSGVQQPGKNDVTSLNPSDGKISASVAWVETAQVLRQQMPRAQFNEFLAPCAGHSWAGDTLTVAAASAFAVQWLELTLHQDMANDALCSVVGCQGSIAYANLPDVAASGTSTVDDQTPAMPTSSAEGAYCPMHEEPHLRRRTQYPSMLRHERKHGDEVFYCAGESGTCSWASSAQVGVFVPAGQLQREPSEVQAAYVLKRRGRGL